MEIEKETFKSNLIFTEIMIHVTKKLAAFDRSKTFPAFLVEISSDD